MDKHSELIEMLARFRKPPKPPKPSDLVEHVLRNPTITNLLTDPDTENTEFADWLERLPAVKAEFEFVRLTKKFSMSDDQLIQLIETFSDEVTTNETE